MNSQLKQKKTPYNGDQLNQANQYRLEVDFAKLGNGLNIDSMYLSVK